MFTYSHLNKSINPWECIHVVAQLFYKLHYVIDPSHNWYLNSNNNTPLASYSYYLCFQTKNFLREYEDYDVFLFKYQSHFCLVTVYAQLLLIVSVGKENSLILLSIFKPLVVPTDTWETLPDFFNSTRWHRNSYFPAQFLMNPVGPLSVGNISVSAKKD